MRSARTKSGINKKGMLYAFMALLLILGVLALQNVSKNQQHQAQENSILNDSFSVVNNRFNNIMLDMVIIGKKGAAKEIKERTLPFSYGPDGNSITFNIELPINQSTIEYYFSSINGYEVFVSDSNYSNIYDGLVTDINTIQDSGWGGTANKLNFYISPQCLSVYAKDLDIVGFEPGNCERAFDINSVERYDLNVNILPGLGEDYNAVLCNIQGFGGCPNQSYDPSNPLPYFELWINDENCNLCSIDPSIKNIRGHFNPYFDNNITIYCNPSDSDCTSSQILIDLEQGPVITHSGNSVEVVTKVDFVSKPHYIYFPDFNVSVKNKIFGMGRRNN